MTRRMLINAQNREELRVAIIDGSTLENFQVEVAEKGLLRGNIYRAAVSNVQPSLNAAFVDYGEERDGFLPFHDIVPQAWHRHPSKGSHPRIEQVLERGRPLIVQVVKDAEGQKGAALTTNVSLAGRYLVFTPFDDTRGVSRKVEDEELRQKLKEQASKLDVPKGGGFIVRTNALEQTKSTLSKDFTALMRIWKKIEADSQKGKGPKELYTDQDIVVRVLRDYLDASVAEVIIDEDEAFEKAQEYVRGFMPRGKTKLVRYSERLPLFTRFDVEPQIERIFDRTVPLPSGGSIVIDRTEALVAIDVNSGKSTRAATQEETAVNTNVEAAAEVARQLRLRDIGGLVVVDFIDMRASKHNALVEKTLRDAMKVDKARTSVGRISSNGLLEINRQKIQQALHLRTHRRCPTCQGTGRIASPEMVSLNLLRRIESRAASGNLGKVRIALHPELADAFQNSRRQEIAALEREFEIDIEVIAATHLHRPEQEIEWTAGEPHKREEAKAMAPAREAPAPQPPPEQAAVEPEAKRGRKRRRGRRRKDHGGEAAPAGQAVEIRSHEEEPQSPQADVRPLFTADAEEVRVTPAEPVAPAAPPKGRKRRRGRRRKEPLEGQQPAPAGTNQADAISPASPPFHAWDFLPHELPQETEAGAQPGRGSEPTAPARAKKRRPRRRSRNKRQAQVETGEPAAPEEPHG